MLSGVDCWSLIPSIPTTVRAFIFSIIILTHNLKAIEINGPINKYGVRKCQTGWSFIATALEIQLILLTKHLSTVKMNAMHSRLSRFVQFTKSFLILKSVNCVQHLNTINNNNANVHRYILVRANVMCTHMCSKKSPTNACVYHSDRLRSLFLSIHLPGCLLCCMDMDRAHCMQFDVLMSADKLKEYNLTE